MKNIFIVSVLLTTILLGACDEKLDLQPEDQLTMQVAFSNKGTCLGALAGLYSTAQNVSVLNGRWQLLGDAQADNGTFVGTFPTFNQVSNYSILADNSSIEGMWKAYYKSIGAANLLIKYVPLVNDPSFSDDERDNVIAQARFIRALMYFNLSNWFSQPVQISNGTNLSVPLVLDPFDDDVKFPSRATLAEIHTQIENDLMAALPKLDDSDNTQATAGACQAFMARLYLYQERFSEAADYANQAIQNSAYTLATDYGFYNTLSNEHFFTLVNTTEDGQGSEGYSSLAAPAPGARGDIILSQNLLDAYDAEPGDLRFSELTQTGLSALTQMATFTNKFGPGIRPYDYDAPVFRVTEMYLTRAEANLREGTNIGSDPLDDINTLRTRAGLADLLSISLDEILIERRKELCFEGHRRMDLLRNNMNLRRPGMLYESDSEPGDNMVIFPIPSRQIQLNPNLEPNNPGY